MAYSFGVCYGARRINPPTEESVDGDMKLIAEFGFPTVRTYGVSGPDKWNVDKAIKHGLSPAIGVWVTGGNSKETNGQIDQALMQADSARGLAELHFDLVIGNEVNRADDKNPITPEEMVTAMKYAGTVLKTFSGLICRVTTCFSGTVLKDAPEWQPVVEACDRAVYLTVYPWYGQQANNKFTPDNIDDQMNWSWENGLSQVADMGKEIVIAEIGWPTAGGGGTTDENQKINYEVTKKYLNEGLDSKGDQTKLGPRYSLWFEMFDEPWKTKKPWESHWGIYTKDATPKWSL